MLPGKTHRKRFHRNSCLPVIVKDSLNSEQESGFVHLKVNEQEKLWGSWCQHTSSLYHSKSLPAPGMAVKAGTISTRLPDEEVLCVRSSCSRMQIGMFSLSHHKPLVRTLVELFTLTLDYTTKSACWETKREKDRRDEGQEKAEKQ